MYRLSPEARIGLYRTIASVEARFGPTVADEVLDLLARAFELLARFPRAGHRREDLTDDDRILFWSVGPTLIAYRRARDGIDVLAIDRADFDWRDALHGR